MSERVSEVDIDIGIDMQEQTSEEALEQMPRQTSSEASGEALEQSQGQGMERREMAELIERAYEERHLLSHPETTAAIEGAIACLNRGEVRVASREAPGEWVVHSWVKKAILLYFTIRPMQAYRSGDLEYYDKIAPRRDHALRELRVVPPAVCRYGAYVEKGAILMPSYINIGAYVASGTMVDSWATVGSCAQIGRNVHLSGGVGIGGVLEPPQGRPVIIEDHAFLGSRAIVVEGALVEEGAVLGANVVITASTPIIDVSAERERIYKGRIPARSVVIPGIRFKDFAAGQYGTAAALIIGKRTESTDTKTSLEQALREYEVSA